MDKQMIEEMEIANMIQTYLNNNGIKVSHPMLPLHIEGMLIKDGYRKIPEGAVVLTKEEYDRLKCDAERYDPFWFCTFGGCEGVCRDCKDDCEMSIFVKIRKETAEKFAEMAKEGAFVDFMGEPIIRASKIDEICKKISEGKK